MPTQSTATVVMRGWQARATSKSPKPAIAMRPGTSQPWRWHSISAPKAERSDTQSTASTSGHWRTSCATASPPCAIEIGGWPKLMTRPSGSPSSRIACA